MKVAIVGSRDFSDIFKVADYVDTLPPDTVVISGGARGVDTWAIQAAAQRKLKTVVYEAQWDKYGKSAGMRRNSDIVANCDKLVAFWDGVSKGTKNSIDKAIAAGKEVEIIRS